MSSVFQLKMTTKLLLLTLFAVCQADSGEPWWIQMFFPNVRFTGKYHPSNYKVEKSPLFPDYVQNPNDVWSPAYWMPYKQAYAQYWIDLIENSTKPEPEMTEGTQAQAGNGHVADSYYQQNGHYGQEQAIAEEASTLAQQVQTQAQNMNAGAQEIVSQVQEEAEKQKEAVLNEADQVKEQIGAELGYDSSQTQVVSAQIDSAAKAQVETIDHQVAQFEEDVIKRFAPLNMKAQEIAMEAAEVAREVNPPRL